MNFLRLVFFSNLSIMSASNSVQIKQNTYISSISAGVLHATSGSINQQMTTATAPVPAKLKQYQHRTCAYSKDDSQEPSLDAPLGITIDHQGCGETEHNGNHVRECKSKSSGSGSKTLLWNFCCVSIADCRSACG